MKILAILFALALVLCAFLFAAAQASSPPPQQNPKPTMCPPKVTSVPDTGCGTATATPEQVRKTRTPRATKTRPATSEPTATPTDGAAGCITPYAGQAPAWYCTPTAEAAQ